MKFIILKASKFILKNLIPVIFLSVSFYLLIYTIYRSEFIFAGDYSGKYLKYYILSGLIIFLSFCTFFLKKKINTNILLILISSYMSAILIEMILNKYYFDKNKYKISKIEFYNSKIVNDEDYRIFLPPKYFIKNNYNFDSLDFFPLSLNRNKKIIVCNENNFWLVQNTDKYGFINRNEDWDRKNDIIFVGDSYAQGQCVKNNENFKYLFEKQNLNILNLGIGGSGTLISNAIYREYSQKDVKTIIWFFYEGNDLIELEDEISNVFLRKYLDNRLFKLNLLQKNKELDLFLEDYHNELVSKSKKNITNWEVSVFKLNKLRNQFYRALEYMFSKNANMVYQGNLENFVKIFEIFYSEIKSNNQELYFIYLPEHARYLDKKNNYIRDNYKSEIKNLIKKEYVDVKFIDVHQEIFFEIDDFSELFPKSGGHYSAKGYKLITNHILSRIR
jgi:lysophospholipase L1-like esterase